MENEKPKIKLSELSDLYDIEDDTEHIPEEKKVEKKEKDWEATIDEGDQELEEEFDNG